MKGSIDVSNFIYIKNSDNLLDKDLYLQKDFQKLNDIINSFDKNVIKEEKKNVGNADLIIFEKKKYLEKEELFKLRYEQLNFQQLTQLFAEMDEETFKENEEAFNYYKSLFFSNPEKKC